MVELIALSVMLVSAAVIIWRFQQRAADKRAQQPKPQSFSAVSIRAPARACSAVKSYGGKRFLGKDAPKLPVAGCSVNPCLCRYVHYADRRVEDRRVQFGVLNRLGNEGSFDRRRNDRRVAA